MTPLEAAWQAALAAPEDAAALRVLADALLEAGDPHGEFIHLQLAGQYSRWSALLEQHAERLLGNARRLKDWFPRFERGFLLGVSLETAADLETLLALPIARLLESLKLRYMLDASLEESLQLLARRAPRTLRLLTLQGPFVPMGVNATVPVSVLLAGLPNLEVLDLGGWTADFSHARSERLRVMTLSLQGAVETLDQASLPRLTELSVQLSARRDPLPLAVLSGSVMPALQALTLEGVLWPELLQELSVSALLRGLKRLDLSVQWGTGWNDVLLETADSFAHLETLNVVVARDEQVWAMALLQALPQARVVMR